MDRSRWLVTVLWFVLVAVGGTVGALVLSDGKDAAWVGVGVLLTLIWAAFVWRTTYRWIKRDHERWRARFGTRRR